jgi:glycerol-3-phosphate acyltransferase PlsX
MVVALDAMGGDHGPKATVPAAIKAASSGETAIALVGDPESVTAVLAEHGAENHPLLQVIPSDGVVEETDNPALVFRSKPRASIFVCSGLVKMGKAQGFVSMGSTGASIAAATVSYGTMPGITRGTLGGPIIGYAPNTVIIDLGANIDIRPQQLAGFGTLGSVMSRIVYGQENPRIALLNVGSEETKGNELVKGTAELLKNSPLNFIGMLEPYDLPLGKADVVICDGFVGNIVLKLTEGLGKVISEHVREKSGDGTLADEVYSLTNQLATYGGGPLLGVNGIAIVGHGAAEASGIATAIKMARRAFDNDFVAAQQQELADFHAAVA